MRDFLARHRFLLWFVLLNALAGLGVGVAKITTSLYGLQLQASASMLGVIAAAQSIGVLLMGIPAGVLVDQIGPLRLFAVGSMLAGGLYFAVPLLPDVAWLALCTALISFCMPSRFVSMNAVFMQQLEQVGASRAGWFRGSHMIGFFLLGPLAAVSIVHLVGIGSTFQLIGVSFFATILIAPAVMRHYCRHPAHVRKLSLGELRSQFRLMWRDAELAQVCLIEFFAQAVLMYYTFFIVALAIKQFGCSPADAASLVSVQGAVFVTVLFSLGGLMNRFSPRQLYLNSFAVVIAALLLLGFTRWAGLLWLGGACLGLGLGLLQTVNINRFAQIGARAGRGSVAGINAFVGPSGGFVGSLLGGWLGQLFGLQMIFLLLAPVFLLFGWRLLAGPEAARVNPTILEMEKES